METQTLDAKQVYQRLDTLLAELHRLRELVQPYVTEKPIRVETEHPHVERVPGVRGGQPVLSGTRIPVWIIIDHFKMGRSLDYILENYDLTAEQVYDALSYYYEHTDEIEQTIALNSDQEYWQEWLNKSCPTIQTEHPHIVRVEGIRGGEPIIKGTGISVRTIVERTRLSDPPEQIVNDYPHLTLAQVYDALSYYHEHPQEVEQYIAENKAALCKTPKSVSS